jgi:hypothetical protein
VVDRHLLDFDEFILQVCQGLVIELKLSLHGAIRDAFVLLQPLDDLAQDFSEGHGPLSDIFAPPGGRLGQRSPV